MLSNFDLNHLLAFPVKDAQARKQFLIGALLYLASFIIPIIPSLFAIGYGMRIMRQVLRGEQPRMIECDDWGEMSRRRATFWRTLDIYVTHLFAIMPLNRT